MSLPVADLRLLQAIGSNRPGGAQAYFRTLAGAFERAGIEQRILCKPGRRLADELRAEGLRPHLLPFLGRPDLLTPFLARRLARKSGANVVMTWMSRAGHQVPRGPYLKVCRVGGYYRLRNFPDADHFVCNAPDLVRHMVEQGVDPERVHLIPNFTPAVEVAPATRSALGVAEGTRVLVILARLHAVKGYDVAIRALAAVPNATLLALGEGEVRASLERLAGSLGLSDRVRFLGWQADPGPILRAADACLMPSRREGFGNVILEAWAHGVPMIASDVSGPAWLIGNGESGVLVPPDDPAALAGAICSVLDDPALAQRLREGGRRKLERNFSEAAIVGQWKSFFAKILSERGQSSLG